MKLDIRGRHVEMSAALEERVETRLNDIFEKYFGDAITANVVFSKDGPLFHAQVASHVGRGIEMDAEANAGDAYTAFDEAAEKLAKRLRRHKRKIRNHKVDESDMALRAASYVLAAPSEDTPLDDDSDVITSPLLIAENQTSIKRLTVSQAVMHLDLEESSALMFHNISNDSINMVYRRADGNIGWVDSGSIEA
ncbi:MAG: ribosome hibernation-promoting factor, HPF/YfiA family [Alphaproteobacteria bacterium]